MKIVPVKMADVPCSSRGFTRGYGRNYQLLVEFQELGATCVEVRDYPHKNANSLAKSLINSIKRYRFPYHVIQRKERVFLIKDEL